MEEKTKAEGCCSSSRGVVVLLIVLFVVSTAVSLFALRNLRRANAEIAQLKSAQVKLMEDYKEVLEDNHKLLTRTLAERYFDALILLRNRIEREGYTPTEEERTKAFDRAAFIVENMKEIDLPKEEAELRLLFIASLKRLLEKGPDAPDHKPAGRK